MYTQWLKLKVNISSLIVTNVPHYFKLLIVDSMAGGAVSAGVYIETLYFLFGFSLDLKLL